MYFRSCILIKTVRVSSPNSPPQSSVRPFAWDLFTVCASNLPSNYRIKSELMVFIHVRVLVIFQEDLNLVIHLVLNVLAAETC